MQNSPDFITCIISDILVDILNFKQKTLQILDDFPINISDDIDIIKKLGLVINQNDNFYQIRVKPQFSESLCGFHSLFYAENYLKSLLKAKTTKEKAYYILKLNSHAKFWQFYNKTLKILLNNPFLDDLDIKELKDLGPLDPTHLEFLMKNMKFSQKHAISYAGLFYGYGYFQCGLESIRNTQQILTKKEDIGVIFLGITSHWMTYFIMKSGVSMLFDSRNMEFLIENQRNIEFLIEIENKDRIFEGMSAMNTKETVLFAHNIRDGRFILKVLDECAIGKYTLFHIYLNRIIFDMIRSYEKLVLGNVMDDYSFENFSEKHEEYCFEIVEKEDNKNHEKFCKWLKNEKRPRVIRDDLLDVLKELGGRKYLFKKTEVFLVDWIKNLREWVEYIEKSKDIIKNEEEPEIYTELSKVLNEITCFFD